MSMRSCSALFVVVCVGVFRSSFALLKPIPFPATLQECYDFRSYNMTPSAEVALEIQNFCYRNYKYKQIADGKIWSGPNITKEGMNYIDSLFRRLFIEARQVQTFKSKSKRQKRQARFPGRYRQEVRSPGAFRRFANCLGRLNDDRNRVERLAVGRNRYQTLAAYHTGVVLRSAHGGPAFLPWHRIYLLLLETACGAPIPYWDSTVDHDMVDPTMSILWSEQYYGNGDGEVLNGPFQNFRVIPSRPLTRDIGTGNSSLFTKEGLELVLSRRRFGEISEPKRGQDYIYSLEGHHNGVHIWVGGHLSLASTAAFDPVFFMHHAYIDAVWAVFREQQIQNGINPERDYPRRTPPGHSANDFVDFRPYLIRVRNIYGMSNYLADLVRYEPFPSCENNCNRSPHMYCSRRSARCISEARRPRARPMASRAFGATQENFSPNAESLDVPSDARMRAISKGPIQGGSKFRASPFRDTRNRDETVGNAPVAPALSAFSARVREIRVRRDTSVQLKNVTNTHTISHKQSISSLERSFTNTFILDGEVDLKRWVYAPVRIVYKRSFDIQGNDPTSHTHKHLDSACHAVQSGATKVFVSSDGLDYSGTYKEYGIVDERQPVSIITTAIGIKNPDYGEGRVLLTSYDSCGRPCRPLCLTSVDGRQIYKQCSGTFKISSALPKMYSETYRDTVTLGDWETQNVLEFKSLDVTPIVTFICDNVKSWPWNYNKGTINDILQ